MAATIDALNATAPRGGRAGLKHFQRTTATLRNAGDLTPVFNASLGRHWSSCCSEHGSTPRRVRERTRSSCHGQQQRRSSAGRGAGGKRHLRELVAASRYSLVRCPTFYWIPPIVQLPRWPTCHNDLRLHADTCQRHRGPARSCRRRANVDAESRSQWMRVAIAVGAPGIEDNRAPAATKMLSCKAATPFGSEQGQDIIQGPLGRLHAGAQRPGGSVRNKAAGGRSSRPSRRVFFREQDTPRA